MSKYRHKEAFCLMWYACPCGHRERFWNSRDGVTPFGGVLCPSCNSKTANEPKGLLAQAIRASHPTLNLGTGLCHDDFLLDRCVPDYKPVPGQRIWRDGTKAEARDILNRRFKLFAERGQAVPDEIKRKMFLDLNDPACPQCKGGGTFWSGAQGGDWTLCDCSPPPGAEFPKGWPMWERIPDLRA